MPDRRFAQIQSALANERSAIVFVERVRWEGGYACPRCGSVDVYRMRKRGTKRTREANHRWRCRSCVRMYSIRTGTVFEWTGIPMRIWLYAMWQMVLSRKSISSKSLSRQTGVSQKSAWWMMRRIRAAMTSIPIEKLDGVVEADEAFFAHRRRIRSYGQTHGVMALVERHGDGIRLIRISGRNEFSLLGNVAKHVSPTAVLYTDAWPAYINAHRYVALHKMVNHSQGIYANGDASTNLAECVWSVAKGVIRTHGYVKHLDEYLREIEFRWRTRHISDFDRLVKVIVGSEGKRLRVRRRDPAVLVSMPASIRSVPGKQTTGQQP